MKKIITFIFLIFTLPILLSLDSTIYNPNFLAKYESPEGILFLSYTETWDEQKLEELYQELLKNKYGEEIYFLQEVRVIGDVKQTNSLTRGQYHALTSTITLFQGDRYTTPLSYREILSHEYGHHFTYYHLKEQHFPFSTWSKLRGLENQNIRWDAFWNYNTNHHQWFPQEIMADDYVLLYGATSSVELKDILSNEAFYRKTQHDNQALSNVLENKALQEYLSEKTGIPIESDRFLETPELLRIQDGEIWFKVTPKQDVAYRLNLTIYEDGSTAYHELLIITDQTLNEISFSVTEFIPYNDDAYIEANLNVLDINTSIGFQTSPFKLDVEEILNY